ncbi:MAG: transposase family protein [Saprospiraceae bacterium]|nr:transposase family protein [Saprospiraceae bacterium]
MAVIDVHSRFILSWDISNTMDATWCAGLVQNSITRWGIPQIINTDQGSQFTAAEFLPGTGQWYQTEYGWQGHRQHLYRAILADTKV